MGVDHYENFPVASWLLPAQLRVPVTDIYRFARHADDIADEGDARPAQRLAQLAELAADLDRIERGERPQQPVCQRLAATIAARTLPLQPFRDLLDAFAQDVTKTRYTDYAELLDYCRRSAEPVGRLMLALYGANNADNLRASDAICSALQLTNFWQDVALDWARGRVYLPQDEMAAHGVGEPHLAAAVSNEAFRSLMAFQVERTRALMRSGAPLTQRLPGRIGLELRMVVAGGLRILDKIAGVDFDVFRRRPRLLAYDWPLLGARAALGWK